MHRVAVAHQTSSVPQFQYCASRNSSTPYQLSTAVSYRYHAPPHYGPAAPHTHSVPRIAKQEQLSTRASHSSSTPHLVDTTHTTSETRQMLASLTSKVTLGGSGRVRRCLRC
eukprot:3090253-Rhodomonas_salina.1